MKVMYIPKGINLNFTNLLRNLSGVLSSFTGSSVKNLLTYKSLS